MHGNKKGLIKIVGGSNTKACIAGLNKKSSCARNGIPCR